MLLDCVWRDTNVFFVVVSTIATLLGRQMRHTMNPRRAAHSSLSSQCPSPTALVLLVLSIIVVTHSVTRRHPTPPMALVIRQVTMAPLMMSRSLSSQAILATVMLLQVLVLRIPNTRDQDTSVSHPLCHTINSPVAICTHPRPLHRQPLLVVKRLHLNPLDHRPRFKAFLAHPNLSLSDAQLNNSLRQAEDSHSLTQASLPPLLLLRLTPTSAECLDRVNEAPQRPSEVLSLLPLHQPRVRRTVEVITAAPEGQLSPLNSLLVLLLHSIRDTNSSAAYIYQN